MLYKKSDSKTYVDEFKKRFQNFCDKAPLLLSYTITPNGVQVINEITDSIYEMSFDYSIPVKSFIYGIKQLLIEKGCYPLIEKEEEFLVDISPEQQVSLASKGVPLGEIPNQEKKVYTYKYMIEKIIVYRDIFIIKDLATNRSYRYHLPRSSIRFLQKLRNKEKTALESGTFFFENAVLMNEIIPQEEVASHEEE